MPNRRHRPWNGLWHTCHRHRRCVHRPYRDSAPANHCWRKRGHLRENTCGTKTITVDVRIIAAANRDLPKAIAEGKFRQDLYYRLHAFPVPIPALRDRREDIPLLVHYFATRFATKIGRPISRVPKEVMQRLTTYAWPGNVRKLENVIERGVAPTFRSRSSPICTRQTVTGRSAFPTNRSITRAKRT